MSHRSKMREQATINGVDCRICKYPNTDFHGFTIQKNHIFGKDSDGAFIVKRATPSKIFAYRLCKVYDGKIYLGEKWILQEIGLNTETARRIFELAHIRPDKLVYQSDAKQVKSFYNPRICTGSHYTPMRNMHIPGGTWGKSTYIKSEA